MTQVSKAFYTERARRGGLARAKALTAEERREIARMGAVALNKGTTKAERRKAARKAVLARWAKAKTKKPRSSQSPQMTD